MKQYCYSVDGENFKEANFSNLKETKEEAVREAKACETGRYYIGESVPIRLTSKVVSSEVIMEYVQECLEQEYLLDVDKPFDSLTKKDYEELDKVIVSSINRYLRKVNKNDFGNMVKNIKEYSVKEE